MNILDLIKKDDRVIWNDVLSNIQPIKGSVIKILHDNDSVCAIFVKWDNGRTISYDRFKEALECITIDLEYLRNKKANPKDKTDKQYKTKFAFHKSPVKDKR